MKDICELDVSVPPQEVVVFIMLLHRLKRKNNWTFNLKIVFDYSLDHRGVYYPKQKGKITINPDNCEDIKNGEEQGFYHGYIHDLTAFGIVAHEFCHFLMYEIFNKRKIIKEYKDCFPTNRFYLNPYSNACLEDEIAELMTLYLTNPYLLKLISREHWQFFNDRFKSPVACSSKRCFEIYEKFPVGMKMELELRWGIVYNHSTEKFEINEDEDGEDDDE